MALSERYLLQGACYGLEQCGLLLQDSAALYERSRYSTADGHAAAQRLRRSAEEVQPSPPIWQTIRHSASATGWTDRRGSLTSAMPVRRWSALIRSRLTGVGSFCTAAQDPRHSPKWGFMSLLLHTTLGATPQKNALPP